MASPSVASCWSQVRDTSLDGVAGLTGNNGEIILSDLLEVNSAATAVDFSYNTTGGPPISVSQYGWVSETVVSATPSSFLFEGVTSGQGATFSIPVDLKLSLFCQGANCDYSHTGTLSLNLPSDVTFTSASGVFLMQPAAAAPEPASWLLSVAGLLLVGGAWTKRKLRQHFQ